MTGAVVLLVALICFAVTFPIGLILTVLSFRKLSSRGYAGNRWLLWLTVSSATLVILFILTGSAADFGDSAQPSVQGYKAMTQTLILWAMIPGASLFAGGAANLIRASRLSLREECH